jgi:hypothetical protein
MAFIRALTDTHKDQLNADLVVLLPMAQSRSIDALL